MDYSTRCALKSIIDDPAFKQQQSVLEAFYADIKALGEEHHALLLQAMAQKDADLIDLQWNLIVNADTGINIVLEFIKLLPRLSRQDAMDAINSFLKSPTKMDRASPVMTAYTNAGEEVHTRYRVDIHRIAELSDRMRDLPQVVGNHIKEDDYCSAYVVVQHADTLVGDIQFSLMPFEIEVYDKSHPGR